MENENKDKQPQEYNPMILSSYIESIDDVREQFGEEYAGAFALRLLYYGVRRKRFGDMNSICNATLESIFPMMEKSSEKAERTKKNQMRKAPRRKANKDDTVGKSEEGKAGDEK